MMRLFFGVGLLASIALVQAQSGESYQCGDNFTGELQPGALSAQHPVAVDSGTILIVRAESLPVDAERGLDLEITNQSGFVVGNISESPEDFSATIETSPLLSSGIFNINITADQSGPYQVFISCVDEDGIVTSNNNLVNPLVCGVQLDNPVIRPDALHRFYIALERDDIMTVNAITLEGQFGEMTIDTGLISPSNQVLDSIKPMFKGIDRNFDTGPVPETGVYRLYVRAFDAADGEYRLSVDCTLSDGLVIPAGQVPIIELTSTMLDADNAAIPTPETPPRLADTIEQSSGAVPTQESPLSPPIPTGVTLPLILNTPNTGSLNGGDAFSYTFDGAAEDMFELAFTRLSGDLNLGLALLTSDDAPIFSADINAAESLMMAVLLPQDDTYTIVVYDLGASGEMTAFTIQGALNP